MRRLIQLFTLATLAAACTSGGKAYIPVDTPLRAWTPPESDAYAPEPKAAPPVAKETPKEAVKEAPKEPVKEAVKEAPKAPTKEKKAEKRP